jgi:hypothetical protein
MAAFRDAAASRHGIARASLEEAPKMDWKMEIRKWKIEIDLSFTHRVSWMK